MLKVLQLSDQTETHFLVSMFFLLFLDNPDTPVMMARMEETIFITLNMFTVLSYP